MRNAGLVLLGFLLAVLPYSAFAASARAIQQFVISPETDFDGGDILSPLGKLGLPASSLDKCAAICLRTNGCVGFTFNQKVKVCLPKASIGKASTFEGAISAVHQSFDAQAPEIQPASAATVSPYLTKSGCHAVDQRVTELAGQAEIQWPGGQIAPGEAASVSVTVPSAPFRMPAFLVLTFDQPVRFRGTGFYVLGPGAIGAFGSEYAKEKTRVIFPLLPNGRQPTATFEVVPLLLSTLEVAGMVIAPSACGERSQVVSKASLTVDGAAAPRFLIYDKYSSVTPISRIHSPAGNRILEVNDGYFRIVAATGGMLIAEITGSNPRFSPTGRFITALTSEGNYVFDSIDGAPITTTGRSIAWDLADSFIIGDIAVWGHFEISSPFVEPSQASVGMGGGDSCHACLAIDDATMKIDLENNFFLSTDANGGRRAVSITNSQLTADEDDVLAFVDAQSGIMPTKLPVRWETRDSLIFTELGPLDYVPEDQLSPSYKLLRDKFLFAQQIEAVNQANRAGEAITNSAPSHSAALLRRLREQYGLSFYEGKRFTRTEEGLIDVPGERGVRQLSFAKTVYYGETDCTMEETFDDRYGRLRIGSTVTVWKLEGPDETLRLVSAICSTGNIAVKGALNGLHTSKHPDEIQDVDFGLQSLEQFYGEGGCGGECGLEAELADDNLVIAWTKGEAAFSIFDRRTNKVQTFNAYRGKLLERVAISDDHKTLIQTNSDGTFALHRVGSGSAAVGQEVDRDPKNDGDIPASALLLGRYVDDELVVWTPQGYFEASYEASQQIHLRFNGSDQLYSFDQFSSTLRRDGLLTQVLDGELDGVGPVYTMPPVTSASVSLRGNLVDLAVTRLAGSQVHELLVYQDGVQTDRVPIDSTKREWLVSVPRRADSRWISFVAVDMKGQTSSPWSADLGLGAKRRNLSVLVVGVDEYDDSGLADLNFAKTDAFRFTEAISAYASNRYDNVRINALADRVATKLAIRQALRDTVSKADGNTDIVLYFSGHGLVDGNSAFVLGLTETRLDALTETSLPWMEVAEDLANTNGRVTVILDNCHSGAAGEVTFASNDGASQALLRRANSGLVVLAASKGRQASIESSAEGGGVFTSALVTVLAAPDRAYDLNNNKNLEISELYKGIKNLVGQATEGKQTPWLAMDRALGEFSAF